MPIKECAINIAKQGGFQVEGKIHYRAYCPAIKVSISPLLVTSHGIPVINLPHLKDRQ